MTCQDTYAAQFPLPSKSRLRDIEKRLDADAEEILREIACVLKWTQQVRREIEKPRPHG